MTLNQGLFEIYSFSKYGERGRTSEKGTSDFELLASAKCKPENREMNKKKEK
jgi:hypothetical protein